MGWNAGGSETSKPYFSSALPYCLFKGRKETWKHIISYYSSLRMQRTKGTLCFKNPGPRTQIRPFLIHSGPDVSRNARRKVKRWSLMIRANRKPRNRSQTKGSRAARPTGGEQASSTSPEAEWTQARPPPDTGNLFPHRRQSLRSTIRTRGPSTQPPEGGLFAG